MYSKAKIFNLALSALLLQRQIVDADTDSTNEANVLRTHWDTAWRATLEDLDLDSTSSSITLELITEDPNDRWAFAYKYPADCAFFRRIETTEVMDNRDSHIPKQIRMYEGEKVIMTDEEDAIAEYISYSVEPNTLDAWAGQAVAYRLASLCAPLLVGKGAQKLREDIEVRYAYAKAAAQKKDKNENFNFLEETVTSEFVNARTT